MISTTNLIRRHRHVIFLLTVFVLVALGVVLVPRATAWPRNGTTAQGDGSWDVHLFAIPGGDGESLVVVAENTGGVCAQGSVEFKAEYLGSSTPLAGNKDPNDDRYTAQFPKFFSCSGEDCKNRQDGSLQVVCELASRTLTSPKKNFYRYYAPVGEEKMMGSDDTLTELRTFASSLDIGNYVIVMSSNTWPAGPSTSGIEFVSAPYSLRNSDIDPFSDQNMSLKIRFDEAQLDGADSLTLRMFEWNPESKMWIDEPTQTSSSDENRVSRPIRRFTTYVLGVTPLWCDGFNDPANEPRGLALKSNMITTGGKLVLENPSQSGFAVSKPFTPSMTIKAWQKIFYTPPDVPSGGSVTVKVLSGDGNTVLIPNASSEASLAEFEPVDYPSLRLRVDMSTTGASPELFDWCIQAEPASYRVYLPFIAK